MDDGIRWADSHYHTYGTASCSGWVPVESRGTGLSLSSSSHMCVLCCSFSSLFGCLHLLRSFQPPSIATALVVDVLWKASAGAATEPHPRWNAGNLREDWNGSCRSEARVQPAPCTLMLGSLQQQNLAGSCLCWPRGAPATPSSGGTASFLPTCRFATRPSCLHLHAPSGSYKTVKQSACAFCSEE